MKPQADVSRALMLIGHGYTVSQVARITGIPRSTVRDWSVGRNRRERRPDDSGVLQLFGTACDVAGVHFTRASPTQIAVYSKDSIAILDRFIGPKR